MKYNFEGIYNSFLQFFLLYMRFYWDQKLKNKTLFALKTISQRSFFFFAFFYLPIRGFLYKQQFFTLIRLWILLFMKTSGFVQTIILFMLMNKMIQLLSLGLVSNNNSSNEQFYCLTRKKDFA